MMRFSFFISLVGAAALAACSRTGPLSNRPSPTPPERQIAAPSLTPAFPNLQAELLDERNRTTASPIGKFDFKNYAYELPRGWHNPDGTAEVTLQSGRVEPVERPMTDSMSNEDRAAAKAERRIGLTYVATKYFDVTGDGQDEAAVILKIETGGAAIPQLVYLYDWKDGAPEMLYSFRTGDRADGGLKNLRAENGNLVVELFGQDRFLLGGVETGRITGDEEQLCCPTFFTRTIYKWNGSSFVIQGKRLTFSLAIPTLPPQQNLGDVVNKPQNQKTKK